MRTAPAFRLTPGRRGSVRVESNRGGTGFRAVIMGLDNAAADRLAAQLRAKGARFEDCRKR